MHRSKRDKVEWARQYETVDRWLDTVLAENIGSENTEYLYAKYIQIYCEMTGKNPDQLVAERKEQIRSENPEIVHKAEEMLRRQYLKIRKTGKKAKAVLLMRCVKSFYANNYVPLEIKDPKVAFAKRPPVAMDDLKLLYNAANPRLKVWIGLLKDTGLSREDTLELKYEQIQKSFEKGEQFINIHIVREKTQVEHDTFLGPNTVEALKLYFRELQIRGIKITPETPIMNVSGKRTTGESVGVYLSRHGKKYGIKFSSHRIRKFFETAMALGKVHPLIVKYWMGHKISSDIESSYIIPPIQKQLELYKEAYKNIDLVGVRMEERVRALEQFKEMLSPEQRELARRGGIILRKGVSKPEEEETEDCPDGEHCGKQKIVSEDKLEDYLSEGWRATITLPSGKIVIER
ncbi:MAG: site-specific integrase [Candidatus Bathyarchaeota archaeon]|nr:site-specific integrase [Candidatus Bathyarchaeota archaeon]MDH5746371.1 site-specific integrase [Candidatus Bathyarchaeota archaeon]